MNRGFGGSLIYVFNNEGAFGSSPTMTTDWAFAGSLMSNYFKGVQRQPGNNVINIADRT